MHAREPRLSSVCSTLRVCLYVYVYLVWWGVEVGEESSQGALPVSTEVIQRQLRIPTQPHPHTQQHQEPFILRAKTKMHTRGGAGGYRSQSPMGPVVVLG